MTTKNRLNTTDAPNDLKTAKWGWACRSLDRDARYRIRSVHRPRPGDVLVARVATLRNHTRIVTADSTRLRMYEGDLVVGTLGNRYATDAFEAHAIVDNGWVDMLTNAAMLGRVLQRNPAVKAPTQLEVLGQLVDGEPVNLIDRGFRPRPIGPLARRVVLVVGSGMNAGKTTSATKLVRGLMAEGRRVAALKVTGSVSPNDRNELAATGAAYVRDFSDYGYPSTFLEPICQLKQLFLTMVTDALDSGADTVVVELADGVLQRETAALMADPEVTACCIGAVLAAPCALSALMGVEVIKSSGLRPMAVTGIINNAPLFVREFSRRSTVPVLTSTDNGGALGRGIVSQLGTDAKIAAAA